LDQNYQRNKFAFGALAVLFKSLVEGMCVKGKVALLHASIKYFEKKKGIKSLEIGNRKKTNCPIEKEV